MKSCTSVTTIGITVHGLEMQVTSATIPTFMTWPSIWPNPACRPAATGAFRNEHAGGTQHRVDDIADPQGELLDAAGDAGADHGLVQFRLGLGERCLGARLLRRQQGREAGFNALLRGLGRIHGALVGSSTAISSRSISRRATMSAPRRLSSCLVSNSSTAC